MEYFDYLRARIPFPLMQEHCARQGLPTARGWEPLRAKLLEDSGGNPALTAELTEKLRQIYQETISVGNRAVKVFEVDEGLRGVYYDALTAANPEPSGYLGAYPRPLTAEQLLLQGPELKVCAVNRYVEDESVQMVLCGRRIIEIKEPRSRSDIGDAAINQFGWEQYDEFIFVKRRYVQSFEVVRYNRSNGILELRVEDHTGADTGLAMQALHEKTNSILSLTLGNQLHLALCRNLFPAIRAIYDNPTEGIVVELGFTTATGSAKHEKMRANRTDLRTELFHVGGKTAIKGALTPFRIAVRWPINGQRGHALQEEVLLPGSIRQLASGTPFLDHMVLSGVLTESMMQAVVARVLAYLPPEPTPTP